MATWLVKYCLLRKLWPGSEHERPCYRVVAEDDPERWIAQTNSYWSREVQEETALLIAEVLSQVLGI